MLTRSFVRNMRSRPVPSAWMKRTTLPVKLGKGRWQTEQCAWRENFVIASEKNTEFRVANPYRIFEHGLEHRFNSPGTSLR